MRPRVDKLLHLEDKLFLLFGEMDKMVMLHRDDDDDDEDEDEDDEQEENCDEEATCCRPVLQHPILSTHRL